MGLAGQFIASSNKVTLNFFTVGNIHKWAFMQGLELSKHALGLRSSWQDGGSLSDRFRFERSVLNGTWAALGANICRAGSPLGICFYSPTLLPLSPKIHKFSKGSLNCLG